MWGDINSQFQHVYIAVVTRLGAMQYYRHDGFVIQCLNCRERRIIKPVAVATSQMESQNRVLEGPYRKVPYHQIPYDCIPWLNGKRILFLRCRTLQVVENDSIV